MIIVISHPADPHAERVLGHLRQEGQEALLLNIAELPQRATLSMDYTSRGAKPRLVYRTDGQNFDLAEAQSVWWRRPQAPDLSALDNPEVMAFTHNEWQEALNGLWQLMDAPWMNPPARDEVASRKALQLRLANEIGLRTPRTLMTSDPDAARRFIDQQGLGRTIFKTFSCTHAIWRETRLVRKEELEILDGVRMAPVIFQEYIPAEADLRVTVVGDQIFPAAIHSRGTDYEVDFRMSLGQARTVACELPADIEEKLLTFMRRLGLVYGAVDFRLTPDGDYVFLEVNTAGEFLFIEERTGQPITQAVAGWLTSPNQTQVRPVALPPVLSLRGMDTTAS